MPVILGIGALFTLATAKSGWSLSGKVLLGGTLLLVAGTAILLLGGQGAFSALMASLVGLFFFFGIIMVGAGTVGTLYGRFGSADARHFGREVDDLSRETRDLRNVGRSERQAQQTEQRVLTDAAELLRLLAAGNGRGALQVVNNLERDLAAEERIIIRERQNLQNFIQDALRLEREAAQRNFDQMTTVIQTQTEQLEQRDAQLARQLGAIEATQVELIEEGKRTAKQLEILIKSGKATKEQIAALDAKLRNIAVQLEKTGAFTKRGFEALRKDIANITVKVQTVSRTGQTKKARRRVEQKVEHKLIRILLKFRSHLQDVNRIAEIRRVMAPAVGQVDSAIKAAEQLVKMPDDPRYEGEKIAAASSIVGIMRTVIEKMVTYADKIEASSASTQNKSRYERDRRELVAEYRQILVDEQEIINLAKRR